MVALVDALAPIKTDPATGVEKGMLPSGSMYGAGTRVRSQYRVQNGGAVG